MPYQINLYKWDNNPKLEGLLFFAQSVHDMLFDYTLDSYRVPELNTHSRCLETIAYTKLLEKRLISEKSLEPVIEEFLWSFKKDYIISRLFKEKKESYIKEIKNSRVKIKDLMNTFSLIEDILGSNYLEECERELRLNICNSPQKKELIYSLCLSFLPELIYSGYSKAFIFHKTKNYFFGYGLKGEINSPEQIDGYFDIFNLEKKEFDLVFKADENFKYIIEIPPELPKPRTSTWNERKFLEERNDDYPLMLEISKIEALDAQSAKDLAEDRMRVWASFLKYINHTKDFHWQNEVLTYELPSNFPLILKPPIRAVHKRPSRELTEDDKEIEKILKLFECDLDEDSLAKILGALKLHTEAVSAETKENQLLTFWSAVEGIFSPPADEVRIKNILNSIEPLLVFDYPKKLIYDFCYNSVKYGEKEIEKIIEEVEGDNTFEKFAAIISIKNNESYRNKIYALFHAKSNILMKNRLYYLTKKLHSAQSIESAIYEHRNRVIWHVKRIYRMRNMIAHSIERLHRFYLDTLIENLHEYLDRILDLILITSLENPSIGTLEEIILKIKLDVDTHLEVLREHKREICLPENYMLFLLGVK